MKLENIRSEEDIIAYIEGCLNDLEFGISDKDDTILAISDLVVWAVKQERKRVLRLASEPNKI